MMEKNTGEVSTMPSRYKKRTHARESDKADNYWLNSGRWDRIEMERVGMITGHSLLSLLTHLL